MIVTEDSKKWLLAQNDQPQFGARPLRRIIGRFLREPLADFLLSRPQDAGQKTIVVDANEDGLIFSVNEIEEE